MTLGVSGELTQLNRAAVHVDVTRYLTCRDTIALGAPVLVIFCFSAREAPVRLAALNLAFFDAILYFHHSRGYMRTY